MVNKNLKQLIKFMGNKEWTVSSLFKEIRSSASYKGRIYKNEKTLRFPLSRMLELGLVIAKREGRKYFYTATTAIQKHVSERIARAPQDAGGEQSEVVIDRLLKMSLDEIQLILAAVYPGQAANLTHVNKLLTWARENGRILEVLAEKGLVSSGTQELTNCREANQRLRNQVEQMSAEIAQLTSENSEMSEMKEEMELLKRKLGIAQEKIEEYVKLEKKRVMARVQANGLVEFGR
jgi:predicted transcriptional regulator